MMASDFTSQDPNYHRDMIRELREEARNLVQTDPDSAQQFEMDALGHEDALKRLGYHSF